MGCGSVCPGRAGQELAGRKAPSQVEKRVFVSMSPTPDLN